MDYSEGKVLQDLWVQVLEKFAEASVLKTIVYFLKAKLPKPNNDAQYRIQERLARNMRVGGDARLASFAEWQSLLVSLQRESLQLVHVPTLLDQLWQDEMEPTRRRPEFSRIVANLHNPEYTGEFIIMNDIVKKFNVEELC